MSADHDPFRELTTDDLRAMRDATPGPPRHPAGSERDFVVWHRWRLAYNRAAGERDTLRVALVALLADIDEREKDAAPRVFWEPDGSCNSCTAGTASWGRLCVRHAAAELVRKVGT